MFVFMYFFFKKYVFLTIHFSSIRVEMFSERTTVCLHVFARSRSLSSPVPNPIPGDPIINHNSSNSQATEAKDS